VNAILAQYRARTPGSAILMERSIDAVARGASRKFGKNQLHAVSITR